MDNNALALMIKPPEPIAQPDLGKVLGSLAQMQMAGAHAGLYSLQAAQQARMIAGLDEYKRTGDSNALFAASPQAANTLSEIVKRKQEVEAAQFSLEGAKNIRGVYGNMPVTQGSTPPTLNDRFGTWDATGNAYGRAVNPGIEAWKPDMTDAPTSPAAQQSWAAPQGLVPWHALDRAVAMHGDTAVDATGKPLFTIPDLMRTGQYLMANGAGTQADKMFSIAESVLKNGVLPTTTGGSMALPGYAGAKAEIKGAEAAAESYGKLPAEAATKALTTALDIVKAQGGSVDPVAVVKDVFSRMTNKGPAEPAAGAPAPAGNISAIPPADIKEQEEGAKKLADYGDKLREDSDASRRQNLLLNQMASHMDGWRKGKWSEVEQEARRTVQAFAKSVGMDTTKWDKPIKNFELFAKDAMDLTRQVVRETSARAAVQEFNMLMKALPSVDVSEGGDRLIIAQMRGVNDYIMAKQQASEAWKTGHNGSLKGFDNHWNRIASPDFFVMRRLAPEDRASTLENLRGTKAGQDYIDNLTSQSETLKGYNFQGLI